MSTVEDTRRVAYEIYRDMLEDQAEAGGSGDFDQQQSIQQKRGRVLLLVFQFLHSCVPGERFKYPEFPNLIIQNSLLEFFEPIKAAEAFLNLETYMILFRIMPWKQEFQKIKKFNGFYQTKIESHLRNSDTILKLIGYSEIATGVLALTHRVNLDQLEYVAFECFVASQECQILENVWSKVYDSGLSVSKLVQIRQQITGSDEDMIQLISSKYKKSDVTVTGMAQNVVDSKLMLPDQTKSDVGTQKSTASFRNKLQNHMKTAKKLSSDPEDIPFMDEGVKDSNYEPVDLDQQIMASLQMVAGKENRLMGSSGNQLKNIKGSQEWNFVREGLEKSYGKQYFEGPRKDLLENEPTQCASQRKEGPYVKVYTEKPDPGYVNSAEANRLKKMEFKQNVHSPEMSALIDGKDSAYASTYQTASVAPSSTALYPPSIEIDQMRTRGNTKQGQVTDTVLAKGVNTGLSSTSGFARTEPIVRRKTAPEKLYHTQPYYPVTVTNEVGQNTRHNLDNIQKYKRSSVSMVQSTGSYFPAGRLTAPTSGSYKEPVQQNTSDSPDMRYNRRDIPLQNGSTVQSWACGHCTYINSSLVDICDICAKSRYSNIEMDSPPLVGHSSKICEHCTLENEQHSVNCHACGHHLKGVHTVI